MGITGTWVEEVETVQARAEVLESGVDTARRIAAATIADGTGDRGRITGRRTLVHHLAFPVAVAPKHGHHRLHVASLDCTPHFKKKAVSRSTLYHRILLREQPPQRRHHASSAATTLHTRPRRSDTASAPTAASSIVIFQSATVLPTRTKRTDHSTSTTFPLGTMASSASAHTRRSAYGDGLWWAHSPATTEHSRKPTSAARWWVEFVVGTTTASAAATNGAWWLRKRTRRMAGKRRIRPRCVAFPR